MVICLERGADLHMAQLMPLPLTVSCFSKIQIGFTFLVLAYPGSPGKGPLNGCVRVCVCITEDYQVPIFQSGPDKEGFNLGCYNNFLEVFGSNKWLWLLPVHSR